MKGVVLVPVEFQAFTWQVRKGTGYEWVKVRRERESLLVVDDEPCTYLLFDCAPFSIEPYEYKEYNPFEIPGLFRVFAETVPTRDDILKFANKYGLLGGKIKVKFGMEEPDPDPGNENPTADPYFDEERPDDMGAIGEADAEDSFIYQDEHPAEEGIINGPGGLDGEPEKSWIAEIDAMQRAVKLWDVLQAGNMPELGRFITRFAMDEGFQSQWIARDGEYLNLIYLSKEGMPRQPHAMVEFASARLRDVVNAHMKNRLDPRLLKTIDPKTQKAESKLHFVPTCLIGALWLQFAQAIDQDIRFHRCHECKKWIIATSDTDRSGIHFCSPKCKAKDYRKRKDRAHELHKEGKSVEEIAKILRSESQTVRGWLREGKQTVSETVGEE